ncbi:MAG: hypothetical protein LW860_10005 [Xanthomonadaceae bacterium]|jgi:hypothetical protein|nr:hypothetical protein [Xanthomonadaceae bacterium]
MTQSAAPPAARRARWPLPVVGLLLAILGFAAMLDAWRLTARTANPVIMADAWYFIDVFVEPQVEGHLAWRDFFAKREATDHSQPLHKAWLAANVRWFGLDFRLDALVAFGGLVLCTLGLLAVGLAARRGRPGIGDVVVLAAIPLLMFSLNSHEIYDWPLVTQYYLGLPFVLLLFAACARDAPGGATSVFAAALAALVVLDGGGVLAAIAACAGLLLRSAARRQWRVGGVRVGAIVAAFAAYKLAWALLMPPLPPSAAGGLFEALRGLPSDFASWWSMVAIAATSSLVHIDHLRDWAHAPEAALRWVSVIGAAMLVLHAAFWVAARRTLREGVAGAFACMLMLYVYGMWAGIVLGRVPVFGVDYLWQARYVAFFQLAIVALALQWLASAPPAGGDGAPRRGRLALASGVVLTLLLGALQVPIAARTWARPQYLPDHYARSASALYCIAAHPGRADLVCPPEHAVCGWSPEVRDRLVAVLVRHQLNAFSPAFQSRHGLHPDPVVDRGCVPSDG